MNTSINNSGARYLLQPKLRTCHACHMSDVGFRWPPDAMLHWCLPQKPAPRTRWQLLVLKGNCTISGKVLYPEGKSCSFGCLAASCMKRVWPWSRTNYTLNCDIVDSNSLRGLALVLVDRVWDLGVQGSRAVLTSQRFLHPQQIRWNTFRRIINFLPDKTFGITGWTWKWLRKFVSGYLVPFDSLKWSSSWRGHTSHLL
jgi:hypothetical protein